MKPGYRLGLSCVLIVLALSACAPAQPTANAPEALPTLVDLNAIATDAAATAQAAILPTRTPLPPTWTPSPEPSPLPTQAAAMPTATPATLGTIFYIFNGDSIVALAADGSSEQLILVGNAPADLTLSPDGTLLAFVQDGGGSAREVFVMNLDGTYVQQVSCLGFARAIKPAWSPDGTTLAFAASQTPDGPLGLFTAGVAGSGQCPAGNNQRQIAQLEVNAIVDGLTWDPRGTRVFYSDGSIYAVSVADGRQSLRLTSPTGFGPDFSPVHNPVRDELFYLKMARDMDTGEKGGTLSQINTASENPGELRGAQFLAQRLSWSRDGDYLLIATGRDIWVLDQQSGSSAQVLLGGNFFPQPTFSPDAQRVAYVDGGAGNITIQQIFTVSRLGEDRVQITQHGEGTILDLVWSGN